MEMIPAKLLNVQSKCGGSTSGVSGDEANEKDGTSHLPQQTNRPCHEIWISMGFKAITCTPTIANSQDLLRFGG